MLALRKLGVLLMVAACSACGSSSNGASPAVDAGVDACPDDAGHDASVDTGPDEGAADDAMSEASSDDAGQPCDPDAEEEASMGETAPPQSACIPLAEEHPIEGAGHVKLCTPVTYATNPPSSGNHYPTWAAYRTYTKPILRGFWVHNLEHGAIVITYNCPDGCPLEIAQAQALIDALPQDCGPVVKRRMILTPDPELDIRFAASAWGFTLRADCFDRAAFLSFIVAHYAQAPEDICSDGVDPTGGPCGPPLCP